MPNLIRNLVRNVLSAPANVLRGASDAVDDAVNGDWFAAHKDVATGEEHTHDGTARIPPVTHRHHVYGRDE